jgi:hypothetical protein
VRTRGQGLLIRFMKVLPAHRNAIIKTMMKSPLIDEVWQARGPLYKRSAPGVLQALGRIVERSLPKGPLSSGATPRVQIETV